MGDTYIKHTLYIPEKMIKDLLHSTIFEDDEEIMFFIDQTVIKILTKELHDHIN